MHIIYRCWLPTTIVKNSWSAMPQAQNVPTSNTHTDSKFRWRERVGEWRTCVCVCICRCMDLVEHGILSSKLFPNKRNTSMHMWLRPTLSSENFCKELFISISLSAGSCSPVKCRNKRSPHTTPYMCTKFDMTHSMLPVPVLVNKSLWAKLPGRSLYIVHM